MDLSIYIFVCSSDLSDSVKKGKNWQKAPPPQKIKIKANKMQIEKANTMPKKMQMDKSIFSPFLSLFDVPFFPHLLCFRFLFSFEVLLFDFPCVFLFSCIFSSLKIIRISYGGEHKQNGNSRN